MFSVLPRNTAFPIALVSDCQYGKANDRKDSNGRLKLAYSVARKVWVPAMVAELAEIPNAQFVILLAMYSTCQQMFSRLICGKGDRIGKNEGAPGCGGRALHGCRRCSAGCKPKPRPSPASDKAHVARRLNGSCDSGRAFYLTSGRHKSVKRKGRGRNADTGGQEMERQAANATAKTGEYDHCDARKKSRLADF